MGRMSCAGTACASHRHAMLLDQCIVFVVAIADGYSVHRGSRICARAAVARFMNRSIARDAVAAEGLMDLRTRSHCPPRPRPRMRSPSPRSASVGGLHGAVSSSSRCCRRAPCDNCHCPFSPDPWTPVHRQGTRPMRTAASPTYMLGMSRHRLRNVLARRQGRFCATVVVERREANHAE